MWLEVRVKPGLITEDGDVTDASTAAFLGKVMSEFHQFIVRVWVVIPKEA